MRCRTTAWDAPHLRVRIPNGGHLRLRGRQAVAGLISLLEDFYDPETQKRMTKSYAAQYLPRTLAQLGLNPVHAQSFTSQSPRAGWRHRSRSRPCAHPETLLC